MNTIYERVAENVQLPLKGVTATINLLDDGATVPFICRYRKELTGSLDEVQVRAIETSVKTMRDLDARREFVRSAISKEGKLTSEIDKKLNEARNLTEIEDIYLPFKPKKNTRASLAKEKGLEALAKIIMAGRSSCFDQAEKFVGKKGVKDSDEAIAGASDIIAEWVSESGRMRNITRNTYSRSAMVICSAAKGKEEELASTPYAMYAEFSRPVKKISSHQYLAMRRAEREGLLKIKFEVDTEQLDSALTRGFIPASMHPDSRQIVEKAVKDASKRLLRPSVENEIASGLKNDADKIAIDIFAQNLRQLLLGSPLKGKRVLAIDPGFRTGCKVVALDTQGNLLEDGVIYPVPPRNDFDGAERILRRMIKAHSLDVIALGNGTASRETERFLKERGILEPSKIITISEDGASVYSASEIGRQEFPDKDVTVRGAVSIGRRLIDPLAELVKIDPKSIGVGQYQHDVDQKALKDSLDFTVVSCVNSVGVDVNTASEKLLSYVSGIGPSLAANIVKYRMDNGGFATRASLKKVPRLGDKAFELAAGFLRVADGSEPLDNTGIHPESYGVVKAMAKSINARPDQLPNNEELLNRINITELVQKGVGGEQTMHDIIMELRKPGRDPRQQFQEHSFADGINSVDDLVVGMVLPGIVTNITNFGAFVDVGVHHDGLVHISQLADNYVSDPMQVVRLHQSVNVRVLEVDIKRNRISLAMKGVQQ